MNKNNFSEKITIVEGFAFIFLSLILILVWILFSDFTYAYNSTAYEPVLIGTETRVSDNGGSSTYYMYKNTWTSRILQTISLVIIFLPVLTTLAAMYRYAFSFKPETKRFLKSFLFLLWLEISFFFLSLFHYIVALKPGNFTLWWEISFMLMASSTLIIVVLSTLIMTLLLLKQKFDKGAPIETCVQ